MATTKKTAAKKTKTTRKTTVRAKTPATRAKKAKAAPAAEKPGDEVKINRRELAERKRRNHGNGSEGSQTD